MTLMAGVFLVCRLALPIQRRISGKSSAELSGHCACLSVRTYRASASISDCDNF